MKRKICFIAQFPLPMHGLSKAVETLYESELANEFIFEKINITKNSRFLKNLFLLLKSDAELFYFTISQTRGGNLRDLIILALLNKQNKKCIVHLHGGYYRKLLDNDLGFLQRKMNYVMFKNLEGAIVLGKSLEYIFEGVLPKEKIFVVPNCIDDIYLMSDSEFNEKMRTIDNKSIKQVLYLSNFIRSKGYPEVLEMAKAEMQRCNTGGKREFHFNFAGAFFDRKEEEFFFEYIKQNHLNDYITYYGVVDGDEKKQLLKQCDVFVLLTRYEKEGQPISILEAMGNGMIVVTTDHAGIPDIVNNGVTGFVLKQQMEIANEAYSIIQTADYVKISKNARRVILKDYVQSQYINNMRLVFNLVNK